MYSNTRVGSGGIMLTKSQTAAGYSLELLLLKEMVLRVIYAMS